MLRMPTARAARTARGLHHSPGCDDAALWRRSMFLSSHVKGYIRRVIGECRLFIDGTDATGGAWHWCLPPG